MGCYCLEENDRQGIVEVCWHNLLMHFSTGGSLCPDICFVDDKTDNNWLKELQFRKFEIFFILFFLIAFFFFKNLTSRPEYNQILVKRPEGDDFLPY
ncbi:hypothetical protein SADUNF_Sadunf14G0076300 [Salix dunnii]|uniref:Uncharacterized protein n=1 Tax=Salix dunnii TaxID=1413687 RepID=A0A835JF82_9ROSI|nr:hypothetical protein SADUNF_Sadunf14G0076300 [Salix dunnii]